MRFRNKIIALVGLAFIALIAVTAVAVTMNRQSNDELTRVETRYLPLLEADRDLKALFAQLPRALEGAVTAADDGLLAEVDEIRNRFVERMLGASSTIKDNGADPVALLNDFRNYYDLARSVSVALLGQHAGEELVSKIERMRAAQQIFAAKLDAATTPDRTEIEAAFRSARNAQQTALQVDIIVALAAMALMLALSWTIVHQATQSLAAVSVGLQRFARGELDTPIVVSARDEFGELAREANDTAARLREYRERNEREGWIKSGVAGLATDVAGELSPEMLGQRVVAYLARYTGAANGAVYAALEGTQLELQGSYARAATIDSPSRFRFGEGIVGQAALDGELRVVAELPPGYAVVQSALGAAAPRQLVVIPLTHDRRTLGVVELAFLQEAEPAALELFRRTREVLGVVFGVAESRQRVQVLLEQTQRQAEELRRAYDILEARNQALEESERRLQQQQEELRTTNEELEEQTLALEAQRRVVVAKNDALVGAQALLEERAAEVARVSSYKSQFLANMSHELRTPLNSIMILSKILAETKELAPKQIEFAEVIHKSGQELLALINDVLDLAKIESGRQELNIEPVPLDDIAQYVRRMFEPLARQKHLSFEVNLAEKLPATLRTDRLRLEQVLKNLLSNALKFTETGGVRVDVRAATSEANRATPVVSISVTDTGIGIANDKLEFVFEAFAQADGGTARKYGGTGLGLSIARQLVVRLGGTLNVVSEIGRGSTFTILLPFDCEDARADSAVQSAAASTSSTSTVSTPSTASTNPTPADDRERIRIGHPSLLIIEDDSAFARVALSLVRSAGFLGLIARDGRSGLELAAQYVPRGILLDVGLPDMDGWTVMERLRANPVTRRIPVHVVSATEASERAEELGAVGYLVKPIVAADLRDAIRTLERQTRAAMRRILTIGIDERLRASLESLLADRTGLEHAATLDLARQSLAARHFECVIIDLDVVGAAGVAFANDLRSHPASAAMPVIAYTSRPVPELEARTDDALTRVMLKSERSTERSLEELRLFLRHVGSDLPPRARPQVKTLNGKKVLVVDDDERNVYALTHALGGQGMNVVTAADGIAALERLREHADIAVVLMDVMMPRLDGLDATRALREEARWKDLPVIALTAKSMPGERKKCLDAGANDYISKPVDTERLLSLLRVWISGE